LILSTSSSSSSIYPSLTISFRRLLLSLSLSRWPDDPVLPLGSVINGEIAFYPPSLFHGGRTVDGGDDRRPHSPFLFHVKSLSLSRSLLFLFFFIWVSSDLGS
ncbi:hypothetical protein LINGRAHAP2_LOCUS23611, partial [Linum grandiflorum]